MRARMLEARKLDRGNPNPSNLGSDFGRFGFDFWNVIRATDARNELRQRHLESLSAWRNAIAHQDFNTTVLVPAPPLRLSAVRQWRSACNALARSMDRLVADELAALVGTRPW